uniref:Ycf54 n=1 Tax=Dasyclonium flaccidum TaxID=2007274 RepID=A0A1Z1MLC6_9FLOR|nr:hypothetical protein [Dasyclonium flaccidum]ARW66544.1 hypothetical protein [Dasyclonium flaccidum]
MYNYYFAAASQNFLLNQEPIEEILRERIQYYKSNNKELDFWFVLDPDFIDILRKTDNQFNLSNPFAAVISLDQQFIQWLKLRIGFVYIGSFKSSSLFIPNEFET